MPHWGFRKWAGAGLVAALAAVSSIARAADDGSKLLLFFDNDLFANEDRSYTTGFGFNFVSGPEGEDGAGACWVARKAIGWLEDLIMPFDKPGERRCGYRGAIEWYTPADLSRRDLVLDDRPYAGYLRAGTEVFNIEKRGTEHLPKVIDHLRLDLGLIGPMTGSDDIQGAIHDVIGAQSPKGWHNQLRNEPTFDLLFERQWPTAAAEALGLKANVAPSLGGNLGNVHIRGTAAVTVRIGEELPYALDRVLVYPETSGKFGWHLFGTARGQAVARDIFLDGNSFRESHSVDKEPFVGELKAGLVLRFGDTSVAYVHTLQTQEYKQEHRRHSYGAIEVNVGF